MSRFDALVREGVFSPLDVRFAETMVRLVMHDDYDRSLVRMAAALASRAVQRGHVCADLRRISEEPLLDADGMAIGGGKPPLELAATLTALGQSGLVSDGSRRTPLVLAGERLYLYRYFDYEQRLAHLLRRRCARSAAVDAAWLGEALGRLFDVADDEQRDAARAVIEGTLGIISGGPGTGKTTTVAKIMALLVEEAERRGEKIRILLVAPTGKAAQRLGESLDATVGRLRVSEEVRDAIPRRASTIHRALGYQPRTPSRFRYGRKNPMSVDVLLADEASMIDLALMTKLLEAVPDSARVILLGDKDQLASVEAGAVLADLCDAPLLSESVSKLTKSFRFAHGSGIAALARTIVRGDAAGALSVLGRDDEEMPYGEVALHPGIDAGGTVPRQLEIVAQQGFAPFLQATDPEERLQHLHGFRILCAHRRGPAGVAALNVAVERLLRAQGLVRTDGDFYDGRPIIVTANDHQLGLFNGDVGVVCEHAGGRRVFFAGQGRVRVIPLGRLPAHETVYAMTVHKSQGSEMDRVALVLPPLPSPVLTRELLYTAVTRARTQVDVFGSAAVLSHGVSRRIERASGLAGALT